MRACDPLLPLLADAFATTPGAAAQTVAAFALSYGIVQFLVGPLGDRFGRTRVMATACGLAACANVAVMLAPTLDAMTVARVLAGAASGGIVPMALALIGDAVPFTQRQQTLARLMVATNMGLMAGIWLGGVLADAFGWRTVFAALALAFATVAAPLWRDARRRTPPRRGVPAAGNGHAARQAFAGFVAVLRIRWARWVLALVFLEGALVFATVAFVPTFLHEQHGLSLGQAGAVMATYACAGLAYAPLAGRLVARLGSRGQAICGAGAIGCGAAVLAVAPAWAWAVPGCLLAGFGFFMLHSTLQLHATQMAPAQRASAISLFVVCLFSGQSLGVELASWAVDRGWLQAVFALTALSLPLLGAAFSRALARHATVPE
jgi:predicted MFS family arabinose efflux permease